MDATPTERLGRFVAEVAVGAGPRFYRLRQAADPTLVTLLDSSPSDGERGVAVTRETIFHLSGALASEVIVGPGDLIAEFGGRRLLTRADLSADRRKLTLFYLENLPAGARIQVTLDGARLEDALGQALDADGDGHPGGRRVLRFDTFGATPLPKTGVEGWVYASERNPDGSNRPLRNVTVTVDGAEETLRTTTDASGHFHLMPSPAGRFFVHVDGRTADGSQWPGGAYYPFVGKAWEAAAGKTNNLAGGTGQIFLPYVQEDALRPVSSTEPTRITPSPSALAARPELAGLEITLPANALFSDNGARGGRVGMAAVPPDRLPEPLPPGLNLPLAITIQTDGGQNFDVPVPVRFPNLPDPVTGLKLPPGAKTVLWSFNHDTGRWEPQGTMTISADGAFAEPDPGVGVRQPGWAGTGPGTPVFGPNRPGRGGGGPGGFSGGDGGGGGGGGGGDDDECTKEIVCTIPQPERRWLNCVLKCARDVLQHPFSRPQPKRSPIESGLRCIGGPDKCSGNPTDTLTPDQRACMDSCQQPEPLYVRYFVPCEGGYLDPCPEPAEASALALAGLNHRPHASPDSDEDLLPDRLVEQRRFWEVEADYLAKLAGTPKFVNMQSAELPRLLDFLDAFSDRVQPASPAGIHLSAEERSFLVGLPRPSQFSASEWGALVDRFDALQGVPRPPEVAAAEQRLDNLVALLKSRGWTRRLDGFVQGYARLSAARAPDRSSGEFPSRAHYYVLRNLDDGVEIRGRLSASGLFGALVLAPERVFTIAYFDPATGRAGAALFVSGPNGGATTIPTAPFEDIEPGESDLDGDGLSDLAEDILGTDVTQADTDQDGIADGAEVLNDGNPLDGIAENFGYQAGVPLFQGAREIAIENDLAVVRAETGGLSFVDLRDPLQPTLVGKFPMQEPTLSLAVQWPYAVVGGTARTTVIDLRDPAAPVEVWSRNQRGYAVAAAFGRVYVAGDDALVAFDLESGLPVDSVRHPYRVSHARLLGDSLVTIADSGQRSLEVLP
ncbi:MAG: carboxypeptidase regulatory-like domain-containing protein, partial [Verrucomicrobiales bacterium]|nr:carboxypeptidase regulatory-like domain-containing protein [Verrucomicrobiales bacterium]